MPADHLHEDHKHTSDPGKSSWATDAYIDSDGRFYFKSKYENHRTIDGDHFVTIVVALDENDNVLAVLKDVTGLDPDPLDIPAKKEAEQSGNLPQEILSRVKRISIEHSMWDKFDDKAIWQKVKSIGGVIVGWLETRDASNGLKIP